MRGGSNMAEKFVYAKKIFITKIRYLRFNLILKTQTNFNDKNFFLTMPTFHEHCHSLYQGAA